MHLSTVSKPVFNILNKSEKATSELFAIYIQNYANQEMQMKVYLNVQTLGKS